MRRERAELNRAKLDEPSLLLLAALEQHPARLVTNVLMEARPDGRWTLLANAPSPTGDSRRSISLWIDEKGVPSMAFGSWHTHADLWDAEIGMGTRKMLDYLERITNGEILLAGAPTLESGDLFRVIDVRDAHQLLDELTAPENPPDMRVFSWSGTEDTSLAELRVRCPTSR